MTRLAISLGSVFMIGALSACGGGGGSGGGKAVSFASLQAEQVAFARRYNATGDLGDAVTPIAAMPQRGSATYTGVSTYDVAPDFEGEETIDAHARVKMTADFGNDRITGTIRQFRGAPGVGEVSGNVTMTGTIAENVLVGETQGAINYQGERYDVAGNMAGAFVGASADGFAAFDEGTVGDTPYFAVMTGRRD